MVPRRLHSGQFRRIPRVQMKGGLRELFLRRLQQIDLFPGCHVQTRDGTQTLLGLGDGDRRILNVGCGGINVFQYQQPTERRLAGL